MINESMLFPEEDELTLYGFISHMETYIKQLLQDPVHAQPDEYLMKHKIDGPKALAMLLKRADEKNPDSAVLKRKERIAPDMLLQDDGSKVKGDKDMFHIRYSLPRKDYHKKMRNLYINTFESHIVKGCPINEDGEGGCCCDGGTMEDMGGATNASSSGQYTTPLFGKPIKRKMHITQEQAEYIRQRLNEDSPAEVGTAFGDFGYDAPVGDGKKNKGNKFYADANDHQNMMEKSWQGNIKESAQGLQSKKLYDIFAEYGRPYIAKHYDSSEAMDLHNVKDEDVVGVFPASEIHRMNDGKEIAWIKSQGFEMSPADSFRNIKLAKHTQEGEIQYVVVINRNANFDVVNYPQEGGFKDYIKKQNKRTADRHSDGQKYYKWKSDDANLVMKNPYFHKWKQDSKDALMNKIRNDYDK